MQIPFKHSIIQSEHLIRTFNPNIQFEHSIQTFDSNIQSKHSIRTFNPNIETSFPGSSDKHSGTREHGTPENPGTQNPGIEHLPENQELSSEFVCKYMQNAQNTSTHRN